MLLVRLRGRSRPTGVRYVAFCLLPFLFLVAACRAVPLIANESGAAATPAPQVATAPIATPESTREPTLPATVIPPAESTTGHFDGDRALAHVAAQLALGPRFPGSTGHDETRRHIREYLEGLGWEVSGQRFDYRGFEAENIIARHNIGVGPVVLLGAHYDTRAVADLTPGGDRPVPGAVDGASGVAVLLELARALDLEAVPREVWLVFFDVEDQGSGGIEGWNWIAGSTYMAENLEISPEAVVVVDMVGDADQQLYYEGNSDPLLRETIWSIAADLGFADFFIPRLRHTMLDDHLPFRERGMTAVLIIDFDYPYWHTVEDTLDKVSAASLARVGSTVQLWLEQHVE